MRANSTKQQRRGLLMGLLVIAAAAIALALIAPTSVGRLLGDLWVSVMGAVFGLVGGLFG
jgi:hypothetical protein